MTTSTVLRGYKYRIYPTAEQEALFNRTVGCCRLVYNLSLSTSKDQWKENKKSTSFGELSALLTQWKKTDELGFLSEVSSVALQQSQRNLHKAFQGFWSKRTKQPKFKKKKVSRDSFTLTRSAFRLHSGELYVAKLKEPVRVAWSRELPDSPSSVTISRNKAGHWFASFRVEETVEHLPKTGETVGLDLGLTSFVANSEGEKTNHPEITHRERQQHRRLSRAVSRKERDSQNRDKARRKLAKFTQKLVSRRTDFLHKLSTEIVREFDLIAIEDLNVQGMRARGDSRKRGLNRAIGEASWSSFQSMLEYKASWYGKEVVVVDRYFPSSQLCSQCGFNSGKKTLDIRYWECPSCGACLDRDINAALNIKAAGLAVSVCGDSVNGGNEYRCSPSCR